MKIFKRDTILKVVIQPLILSLVLISSLFLLSAVIFLKQNVYPDISTLGNELLQAKSNEIDLWLESRIEIMERMGIIFGEQEFSSKNKTMLLTKLSKQREFDQHEYDSMGFITLTGKKYLTNGSSFDVSNRRYFERIQQSSENHVVSSLISSKADNQKVVLIVTKVLDESGQVKGYLSVALPMTQLKKLLTNNSQLVESALYDEVSDEFLVGKGFDETGSIHFSKKIPSSSNLLVQLAIPNKRLYSNLTYFWVFIICGVVLLIAIGAIITYKQVKGLKKSITNIETGMSQVVSHQYLPISQPSKIHEIKNLEDGYNQLIAAIQLQKTELIREQKLTFEAENKALYSQIKPHFLYNTLETIQSLANNEEMLAVEHAVGDLARFYRVGLSDDRVHIALEQELVHVESYLNIMKLRYEDDFEFTVQNEVSKDLMFLKFTLQPLIENALYHGIRMSAEKGEIQILLQEKGSNLCVTIANTNYTTTEEEVWQLNQALETNQTSTGYGLYNVNQRLKNQYGTEYGISIRLEGAYFIAEVGHPKIRRGEYK
ncbi:two-component system, sensor histidine kinase YesM [Enterococcus sp. AZ194]|uniref:cache domain-containing sensor histidine kinase n=1 Tax=Enterococcus sp. AZ194 TaxID=2774629 RepID=UPI003F285416